MTNLKCQISFGGELRQGGRRIRDNLIKFAPDNIQIVDTEDEADMVIFHHQYKWDLDHYLHECKKPMIFLISELQQPKEYFKEMFSNPLLKMTYTFHPLKHFGYVDINDKTNHVLAPWGVDEFFESDPYQVTKVDKPNGILAMGFYDSEHYNPIYQGIRLSNIGEMIHLDIKKWDFLRQGMFFDEKYHWWNEWVTDEELKNLYQSCKFVSGLRSNQGFEVGVLEGILNSARPICFDNIYYRQFFNDFAVFIPEEFDIDMTNNLVQIFNQADSYKVHPDEIQMVRDRFNWKTIATNFWKEVNASL